MSINKVFFRRPFKTLISSLLILIRTVIASFFLLDNFLANYKTWTEITSKSIESQLLDKGSLLKDQEGNLLVLSLFKKFQNSEMKDQETTIYSMNIDYQNKLYRDILINSIPIKEPEWNETNGDVLIEQVINYACKSKVA